MDCNYSVAKASLCYESVNSPGYQSIGCISCLGENVSLLHCSECPSSKNCLGCVGLKTKQYCILNKQYSKEEYEELAPKVIDHMRKNNEWGQFFPTVQSPFAYNETIASEYFPMTKVEVEKRGWRWKKENIEEDDTLPPLGRLPDDIADATDDLAGKAFRCEATGKPYKILQTELAFYRSMHLPLPRLCFKERQRLRFQQRNPRKLWDRQCQQCQKSIRTTYAPERPEHVYCEECYLATVY
jgi:hypothetical protein